MEELGEPQIPDSLFDKSAASYEFEALHLPEVGFLPGHIDKEELGDIARPHGFIIFLI